MRATLQTLFFGISADASGRSLLEEYIFNFDFSDGGARLDLTTDGKSFSSSKAAAGQVKRSVIGAQSEPMNSTRVSHRLGSPAPWRMRQTFALFPFLRTTLH